MEVGAVKQAFNNEVIHLKKSLNQAKIHTIHKLTRKAKTFSNKKSDKLKDKLKRKAESAVNEVLIIKKLKPRDLARFIVTHKGDIADYINKPEVDQNKACARLLLHKAMQEKYKTIRNRFGNISINDLLMSRHERRKLKKELQEKQKNKRNGKNKTELSQSQVKKGDAIKKETENVSDGDKDDDEIDQPSDEMSEDSGNELNATDNNISDNDDEGLNKNTGPNSDNEDEDMENGMESTDDQDGDEVMDDDVDDDDDDSDKEVTENDDREIHTAKPIKASQTVNNVLPQAQRPTQNKNKKTDKRKESKNKNINEKILKRNFNKHVDESPKTVKIVDPFFKTSSGDNYMSLAEPRAPDEFKEVHKQGNRQYRRAVMFGHVPKSKPRNFNQDNKHKQFNKFNKNDSDRSNNKFNVNKKSDSFIHNHNGRNDKYKKDMPRDQIPEKPEKLHPSWEAKKKLSSVLPFQGKKIKFDDS